MGSRKESYQCPCLGSDKLKDLIAPGFVYNPTPNVHLCPILTSVHKTEFFKLEIWGKDLPFQPRALKRTDKECWGAMPAALHGSSNLRAVGKVLVSWIICLCVMGNHQGCSGCQVPSKVYRTQVGGSQAVPLHTGNSSHDPFLSTMKKSCLGLGFLFLHLLVPQAWCPHFR